MSKIVVLDSYSWNGISFGATHYYGNFHEVKFVDRNHIHVDMNSVQIHQPRTVEIAAYLNKVTRERYSSGDDMFEVGEPEERFDSLKHLTDYAVEHYREYYPEAIMLLHNTGSLAANDCFVVLDAHVTLQRYTHELDMLYRLQQSAHNDIGDISSDDFLDFSYELYKRMSMLLARIIGSSKPKGKKK